MAFIALNNALSTLVSGIGTGDTSVNVQTGHGTRFAVVTDYTYITFEDAAGNIEVCKLTAQTGDWLTIVRAQDGTMAQSWDAGDIIECRPCAAAFNDANTAAANAAAATTVAAHVAASDPHMQYLDAADLAAHVAASDPHMQYRKESDVVTFRARRTGLGQTTNGRVTLDDDGGTVTYDGTLNEFIIPETGWYHFSYSIPVTNASASPAVVEAEIVWDLPGGNPYASIGGYVRTTIPASGIMTLTAAVVAYLSAGWNPFIRIEGLSADVYLANGSYGVRLFTGHRL